jgi:hypothetical protein
MEDQHGTPWSDLLVAILAVNRWPVEKVYTLLPTLEEAGLLEPNNLAAWGIDVIKSALEKSGYTRGDYMTTLMAGRLKSLGIFVAETGREGCERLLRAGAMDSLTVSLGPVRGIGPAVLGNYVLLRGTVAR